MQSSFRNVLFNVHFHIIYSIISALQHILQYCGYICTLILSAQLTGAWFVSINRHGYLMGLVWTESDVTRCNVIF